MHPSAFTLLSHDFYVPGLTPLGGSPAPVRTAFPPELQRRLAEDVWGMPYPYFRSWNDGGWLGGPGRGQVAAMGHGPYGASGSLSDRRGGKNAPLFWSEIDLRGFRITSRYISETNWAAIGFMGRLVDYHVRKGFGWQACRRGQKKGAYQHGQAEDPVVANGQRILDQFRDRCGWPVRSREGFRRWRRDGEVFNRFFERGWGKLPVCRFVEPEQIGHPDGETEGRESFGICTDEDDAETIEYYYVRDPDGDGRAGDWVDAGEIVYAKANVDGTVKRGLPDLFPVADMLDGVRRLLRNVVETSVTQAAVAWREKFPTATAAQVQALIPVYGADQQLPSGAYPGYPGGYPGWPYDSNQVRGGANRFPPGTVVKTEGNREYEDGPVASGIPNYLQVEQAVLRGCGARWGMPEYFSGDASNNNFASSLVAGSPFVCAVEGCQLEWGVFERACALKVLDLAAKAGLLTADERRQLDVEIQPPDVATADPQKDAEISFGLFDRGLKSAQEIILEDGRDPAHTAANLKAWNVIPEPIQAARQAGDVNPQGNAAKPGGNIFAGLSESVVTVHRADGTTYQQTRKDGGKRPAAGRSDAPSLSAEQKAHALAGLDEKLPDAVRKDAGVVAKVKDAALTVAAKLYMKAVALTPAALKVMSALGAVLDTPEDMKKLGYNPTASSGVAGHQSAPDAIKDATGLSTHMVATVASHVLAKVAVMVKAKLGRASESVEGDGCGEVGQLLADLFADLHAAFGMDEPAPDADTLAATVRELVGAC